MRTWMPALLLPLALLLAGCVAAPTPGAAQPIPAATTTTTTVTTASPAADRTTVVAFHPWHNGQVDTALRVVRTAQGSCADPSSATSRPDAYRCDAGGEVADPCFADTGSNRVACVAAPTEVLVLTLADPLPPTAPDSAPQDPVFLLVLADGTVCHASTGAGPAPRNGVSATMYCGSGETSVWGQPDTTTDTWTVRVGADGGPLTTNRVRTAYR